MNNITTKSVLTIDKTEEYMSRNAISFSVEKQSNGKMILKIDTSFSEIEINEDDMQSIIKFLRGFIE